MEVLLCILDFKEFICVINISFVSCLFRWFSVGGVDKIIEVFLVWIGLWFSSKGVGEVI